VAIPEDEFRTTGTDESPGELLTRRERDVLALLAQGCSGPEIAAKLTLGPSSVQSYI
jgi:DNA-binding NarL/FixJ family response regulator